MTAEQFISLYKTAGLTPEQVVDPENGLLILLKDESPIVINPELASGRPVIIMDYAEYGRYKVLEDEILRLVNDWALGEANAAQVAAEEEAQNTWWERFDAEQEAARAAE